MSSTPPPVAGNPGRRSSRLTYNFLPFMVLPLYVSPEKIDHRLLEAAGPVRRRAASAR